MARLVVFAGLPATGKSTIARALAESIGAVWLRIDSIEQAILSSGVLLGTLDDAGYRVGYALARDNLRLGRNVVADSVNPWMLTRDAWRQAGLDAGAAVTEIEVVCGDREEHRRRVETRATDVPGLVLPDWDSVIGRDYRPWDRDRVVIDTASGDISACVALALAALG